MEVGTPVLLLDLTKRLVMPPENTVILSGQSVIKTADTVTHPAGEDAGPAARSRQIEWYQKQVEKEEARRVEKNLPSYDLDVCMISHFHDGAPCMQHSTRHKHVCHAARVARAERAARVVLAVLLEDGNYQTGDAKQKAKSQTREKLWQAIQRAQLWHPQVNDDEMPSATAEQVRVHAAGSRCTPRLSFAPLAADRRCGELASRDGPTSKLDEC